MVPNAGIGGVLTIHRFGHQWGRRERSGRVSTAKIHVFSARVFLDRSQNTEIHNITIIPRQNWVWGRGWGSGGGLGTVMGIGDGDWGQGLGVWGLVFHGGCGKR